VKIKIINFNLCESFLELILYKGESHCSNLLENFT